ncbi:uncharacterized protein LOC124150276 isoform X1 [Haliotis rufescens]|uniref:uncharacterized protein LOC124150276 isoform X1 n=1 Tax=Haliotis rufescens TaxID=6454 RepID=UPI00201F5CA0|nr:uncharacterized protein LOC124150276 isoform X1 [Haliotis rufescens]
MQHAHVGWAQNRTKLAASSAVLSFHHPASNMIRGQQNTLVLTAVFLGTLALATAFSLEPFADSQPSPARTRLLELLYNIDGLLQASAHSSDLPDNIKLAQPRDTDFKSKGEGDPELAKKRDMGVLPPWNEFCRMMRITNCFHSQH